jgi:diaminopimelate decarboxylase
VTGFHYEQSHLVCDGVPLATMAAAEGTPLYVYSAATIVERCRELQAAFAAHPPAFHYALKANSTLAIVRLIHRLGCGADANSGGEIEVALRAGFEPSEIVFTGVGKTPEELTRAVSLELKAINAESAGELERLDRIARARGVRARVALRVNPDIDAQTHPHISTGRTMNKFGVPIDQAREICRAAGRLEGLALVGLHLHVGSQIVRLEPLARAATAATGLARVLRDDGILIEHLDLGGGLGISYDGAAAPTPAEYAAALLAPIRGSGLALVLEPGRVLVGPAGVLVTRVVDVKPQPGGKRFVVLDAGMTELLRPALYGAYHRIEPVERRGEDAVLCDVVGPVCETSDSIGLDRALPPPQAGDLLAVMDAGAYGAVMASNYNRRPVPPEVIVEDGRWRLIRRRQTVDDMLAFEL